MARNDRPNRSRGSGAINHSIGAAAAMAGLGRAQRGVPEEATETTEEDLSIMRNEISCEQYINQNNRPLVISDSRPSEIECIPAILNFNGKEVARVTEEGTLRITSDADVNLIEMVNKKGQTVFTVDGEGNVSFAGKLRTMEPEKQKEADEVLTDREDKKTERFEDLIMEDE